MENLIELFNDNELVVEEGEFVHLHCHNNYSLLDGFGRPEEHVKRAKELGMKALAITNHNHLAGIEEFQKACKKEGIKPILGVELYWTKDMNMITKPLKEREKIAIEEAELNGIVLPKKATKKAIKELVKDYMYDTKGYHIILLAKNQEGWKNLVKIQAEASKRGLFNGRYHCDNGLLAQYSEGVIVTTACIGSVVSSKIREGNMGYAYDVLKDWINIFGKENVFAELQGLDWDEQFKVNMGLIQLSNDLGINLIATNDVHYPEYSDIDDHDSLLCIGIDGIKLNPHRMKYEEEFWIKNYDEMIKGFRRFCNDDDYIKTIKKALYNTNIVADMIEDIKLGSDKPLFTETVIPEGYTNETYLSQTCWKNLYKYLKKNPHLNRVKYEKTLRHELNVINTKGYAPYMITTEEIVSNSHRLDCQTGPGRGSAAGSLVLFLLNITQCIDPLEYGLLFSRFLTMDRTALPDVDIDFCYYGRDRVINWLKERYGADKVAHIGTITALGVKNGIKDIGRIYKADFQEMNRLTKELDDLCDNVPSISFKMLDSLEDPSKVARFKELEEQYSEIFRLARRIEGYPRNLGVHASGILITPCPVNDYFPTRTDNGIQVTLWTGEQIDSMNGVKYDILGLKTISVIDMTLKTIGIGWSELYRLVEADDKNIFSMLCDKDTDAIFQIESDLFKGVISDMQPSHLNDIIALTALCRPGPLSAKMHDKYNKRKNGLEEVDYQLPGTQHILEPNYGAIIYQEDIMRIAKDVAGFDDNQADSYLRKATAKKKKDLMDLCKRWLIYGKRNEAIPEGYDNHNPDSIMYDPDNKYGSPISGAISKGISVEKLEEFWCDIENFCSYLFNKSHAACYSFITLLTAYLKCYYPIEFFASVLTVQNDEEKQKKYIQVLESKGIKVSLPNINRSQSNFVALPEKKEINYGLCGIKGVNNIDELLKLRPFTSMQDVFKRTNKQNFGKKIAEALTKAGAFDTLEKNRYNILNSFYTLRKDKTDLFPEKDFNQRSVIEFESEVLATPITYKPWFYNVQPGSKVSSDFEILKVTEKIDKKGGLMAFVELQSEESFVEGIIFASSYKNCVQAFDTNFGTSVHVTGKKDDNGKLIINRAHKILAENTGGI